jgi:hypothetical protein
MDGAVALVGRLLLLSWWCDCLVVVVFSWGGFSPLLSLKRGVSFGVLACDAVITWILALAPFLSDS